MHVSWNLKSDHNFFCFAQSCPLRLELGLTLLECKIQWANPQNDFWSFDWGLSSHLCLFIMVDMDNGHGLSIVDCDLKTLWRADGPTCEINVVFCMSRIHNNNNNYRCRIDTVGAQARCGLIPSTWHISRPTDLVRSSFNPIIEHIIVSMFHKKGGYIWHSMFHLQAKTGYKTANPSLSRGNQGWISQYHPRFDGAGIQSFPSTLKISRSFPSFFFTEKCGPS